jgi:hypothetical protein
MSEPLPPSSSSPPSSLSSIVRGCQGARGGRSRAKGWKTGAGDVVVPVRAEVGVVLASGEGSVHGLGPSNRDAHPIVLPKEETWLA